MKRGSMIDRMLIAAAVLLGGYLIATSNAPTQSELEARKNNILQAFSPLDIEVLSWELENGQTVKLRRDGSSDDASRYFLGEGGERVADAAIVGEITAALDFATWNRELGEPGGLSPEALGFDRPRLEFRVVAGPRSYRLVFGKKAPSPAQSVYLQVDGDNIEPMIGAADEELLTKLARTRQEFFGGLVFPYTKGETKSLRLEHDGGAVTLKTDSAGFLVQSEGASVLADRTLVDLIFYQLARTRIDTYLDAAEFEPQVKITQEGADGVTFQAALGGQCPDGAGLLAKRKSPDPMLGCVPRSVLAALKTPASRLTSSSATSMNADEIDHIIVQRSGKTIDVIREGAQYKLLSRESTLIPQESGDEFFEGYTQGKLSLLAEPPEERAKVGEVTLKGQIQKPAGQDQSDGSDRPHRESLDLYESGDSLLVLRKSDGAWLSVPPSATWLFSIDDGWARDRTLATWENKDIKQVAVRSPDGFSYELRRTADGYELGADGAAADSSLSRDVFRELAQLRAVRFLPPSTSKPTTGLFEIEFRIDTPGGAESLTLSIGERVRGGYVAWSSFVEGAFVLPLESKIPFTSSLKDRSVFRVRPADAERLSIDVEGRKFEFERQGGALRGTGGEATDNMAEPLMGALRAIQVVSAAGNHPEAQKKKRGRSTLSIAVERKAEDGQVRKTTFHFGAPTVWLGISTRVAWIEGDSENYFVSEASLAELRELL